MEQERNRNGRMQQEWWNKIGMDWECMGDEMGIVQKLIGNALGMEQDWWKETGMTEWNGNELGMNET